MIIGFRENLCIGLREEIKILIIQVTTTDTG